MKKYSSLLVCTFLFLISCAQESQNPTKFKDVTDSHLDITGLSDNSMDAAVVDIDQDGDLDIVLAIEYKENILLINDGSGRLVNETKNRLPSRSNDSEDIAAEDFDLDGDIDLVFVSEDDQINEYYLNDGKGVFTDVSDQFPVRGTTNAVEAADFDQDGDMDLLLGNAGSNVLLINDGKGNFSDGSDQLPNSTATTQDIDVIDLDNDGDLDVVVANETTNEIWINDGSGAFTYAADRLPSINDQTREVDLADIDNDGDPDIVFGNVDFGGFGNPQNRLLVNDGNGYFQEITDTALPESDFRTVDIDFADINGDGYVDLLSGNRWNDREKLVLINNGSAVFEDQTNTYFPSLSLYVFDFQFADFNNDGYMDIYLCAFSGTDKLLFGTP